MNPRFHLDLLHPGWVTETWRDWFVGPRGLRHLSLLTLAAAAVLLVAGVAVLLAPAGQLAADLRAVPHLRSDLAAREAGLGQLRASLQGLTQEARRQVPWTELLTTFSQQVPPTLKLHRVEVVPTPAPAGTGSPPAGPPPKDLKAEGSLRIEAITPQRPGSAPVVEVAQFMAGLMRDPAVQKRFQLKSWEIKPETATEGSQLHVVIVLSEKPR
ncbi:MAG: hypothetical protein ACREMG_13665 [Gemmatimonadales bacterium]